jgi:hypothetical protein
MRPTAAVALAGRLPHQQPWLLGRCAHNIALFAISCASPELRPDVGVCCHRYSRHGGGHGAHHHRPGC